MKTQIVQQNNRKTTIEYFSRSVEVSTSTTRKTKIFLDNLIQGSVELFVPSSQDSLSFASKTNVTQVVNTTKTSIVQNIAGKTFLSGVTNLTIQNSILEYEKNLTGFLDSVSFSEHSINKIFSILFFKNNSEVSVLYSVDQNNTVSVISNYDLAEVKIKIYGI